MKTRKMIFESDYLETIKKLVTLKLNLQKEAKNQEEILNSEALNYTPDFSHNIESLIGDLYEVLNSDEDLENDFTKYHWLVNYDGLKDVLQYNLDTYLNELNGLTFDSHRYYLIDYTYATIKEVDLSDLQDFYDTLCDKLIEELGVNIANLDDIDDCALQLNDTLLTYNKKSCTYVLTFKNNTTIQSETLHTHKIQSPLFSNLIVKCIKEVR